MSKKKKKKLKVDLRVLTASSPPPKNKVSDDMADDRAMDFGGLPNRDLKKNLGGCG